MTDLIPTPAVTQPAPKISVLGRLMGFFQDDTSALSMMRLIVFIGIPGTLLVWAIICWHKRELVDIPPGMLVLHGGLLTGKMVQNKQEQAP